MAQSSSIGQMHFNLVGKRLEASERPDPETPFRMVVLGDFSGRTGRLTQSKGEPLRPIAVDCDNLDKVIAKLNVSVAIPVAGSSDQKIEIGFKELEDFHPDQIYQRLELFQAMRKTRRDLLNSSTFEAAAAEVRGWAGSSETSEASIAPSSAGKATSTESAGGGDPFAHLLSQPSTASQPQSPRTSGAVQSLLKQVVGPHVVPNQDPQQDVLVQAVDTAASHQLRSILHDPAFQALESAWRALDYLVRNLETDEQLKLYIVDISKQELNDDLAAAEDLALTDTYQLVFEQAAGSAGGQPWAVVIGNYQFDATEADGQMIGRMATIAAHAKTPFIASASSYLLGCESLSQTPAQSDWNYPVESNAKNTWDAVRQLKQASYIGLALPGFLLRLPYGSNTEPIDSFQFEEIEGDPAKGAYLWGNAAFICAYLLGQEYTQRGWHFTPGAGFDIEDLPAHTYKEEGESKMTPCAEAWLSDSAAETILNNGLMPLVSIHNRDAVRLTRFQSISQPTENLSGRWS